MPSLQRRAVYAACVVGLAVASGCSESGSISAPDFPGAGAARPAAPSSPGKGLISGGYAPATGLISGGYSANGLITGGYSANGLITGGYAVSP